MSSKEKQMPRMQKVYNDQAVPALVEKFGYKNKLEVPSLKKISLNMGLGEAKDNARLLEQCLLELSQIAGQKPVITKARKSEASFKLRAGDSIGCMVTLRRERMYEFLDRLITAALPRVRDFKGVSAKGFDGHGNFTMGIKEQIIFPEVNYDHVVKLKGINVSIVTTAKNDEEGRELMAQLGMPFRK